MREAALVFLGFFAFGAWQAAPGVTTGDAGELAAAAAVWGVPHAPGYAAWTVLARAFGLLLPAGTWAYRGNLLSALCGAAALALLGDALRRWGASRPARLAAVAALGLSPLWREQSAVVEVFMPMLLAAALLLWLAAAAGERLLEPGPAAALGLVFGLGLGAHQTLALILPALLLLGAARPAALARALPWAAAGTLAGLALHLAIPLRAAKSPPLDWGHAVTWTAFKRLLLRSDYGTLSLTVDGARAFGPEEAWAQAWRFARAAFAQLGVPGTALAALGALGWRRAGLTLPGRAVAAWLLLAGPGFLLLGRPGFDAQTEGALPRFYLLPLLAAAPLAAAGVELLARRSAAGAWAAATLAAAWLAPGALAESRRGDYMAHDYGRAILRSLPPKAVLVMDGGDDTFYALMDLVHAEGLRPDLELRDRGGVVFPGGYGADFRALDKDSKEARRRAVEARWDSEGRLWYSALGAELLPGRTLVPAGLLRRPAAPGAAVPEAAALREGPWPRRFPAGEARRYRDRALSAFFPYMRGADAVARGDAAAGAAWLELAAAVAPDALWTLPSVSYALGVAGYHAVARKDLDAARLYYEAACAVEPLRAEPRVNLGVTLERAGRLAEAEAALREAARVEPSSGRAHAALAARLWASSRWAEAADSFASAAAAEPGNPAHAHWAARARAKAAGR